MKIALVNFPLLDIGGITTWDEAIGIGYQRCGHETQRFYAIPGHKYSCKEDKKAFIGKKYRRGEKLPAKVLSYGEKKISKSIKKLNEFDVVHFVHPSPHPTKGQVGTNNPLGWLELYAKVEAKKIVTMHDAYWDKTNKWFILARDHIDLLIASQYPHFEAVLRYPTVAQKVWSYFPIDVEGVELSKRGKNPFGMVAHQWIKWKNHHKIMKALKGFDKCPIQLYAGGQEYHNLLSSGELQEFVGENQVEEERYGEAPHTYFGYVKHEKLTKVYSKALFSIDGSQRGYNNYTHFEPMLYGAISFVHEDVMGGEYNTLPEDCVVTYNWENLQEKIEHLVENPKEYNEMRKKAYNFVVEHFACELVAGTILDSLKGACDNESGHSQEAYDSENAEAYELKAINSDGWDCAGQFDRNDPEYESVCKVCHWYDACERYTALRKEQEEQESGKVGDQEVEQVTQTEGGGQTLEKTISVDGLEPEKVITIEMADVKIVISINSGHNKDSSN